MPRFPLGFNRRKSAGTIEEIQNAEMTGTEQSSFRVIERTQVSDGKSFDGGARLARASAGNSLPRPNTMVDLNAMEDNMFADLKGNRGSGASNTTKATSTDTSSRHSNASTAPSSADAGANGHDDSRNAKKPLHEAVKGHKSNGSGFLSRAGRTFSFGGQKKNSIPPPADDEPLPDVPSVPSIQREDIYGRSRGMTASTTSTATPPKLEGSSDLGGDFGSMFSGSGFDKRASTVTLKNNFANQSPTTSRQSHPAPLHLDHKTAVEPPPHSWASHNSNDNLLGQRITSPPISEHSPTPPAVPRHLSPNLLRSPPLGAEPADEEDARLLQDSMAAASKFLSNPRHEDTVAPLGGRKPVANSTYKSEEDNLFVGTSTQFSRAPLRRAVPSSSAAPQNRVMTPAEFERYRKDRERTTSDQQKTAGAAADDDDEDEINYDDDEDEIEKSKQQTKQRRKQEAHMAVYRQQMMKVTGEPTPTPAYPQHPGLNPSMSATSLHQLKTPSPDMTKISDEEEDDDVPLAILQAHGFPNKNRPPTRLNAVASNPNLRSSMLAPNGRPGSSMGESTANQRHSTLPAFARGLPQDPFVGASISRPAVRESLSFAGGSPAMSSGPDRGSLPPGGLVGVIASEERSRAMRRGSPNIESQRMMGGGAQNPGFDPIGGIPHQMMYGMQGMPQMPGMPGMPQMMAPPQLTPGDQAQIQMTQQMQQFMQMQMQFMQMMAVGQNGASPMPPQPGFGMPPANQSMTDLGSRQSMVGDHFIEPRRMDAGMRTMSMVQPSSASFLQQPGYAGSIRASGLPAGYTPSIAPSERSNIGLPGRYRPVSQAPAPQLQQRSSTMSGGLSLSRWEEHKNKPTINVVGKAPSDEDDDDDEGWEAMKATREKKKSSWKTKKVFGTDLSAIIN